MTEAEFMASTDPAALLEWAQQHLYPSGTDATVSARKLRLFACACCRQVWDKCSQADKAAIEAGERFADGGIDVEQARYHFSKASRVNLYPIVAQMMRWYERDNFQGVAADVQADLLRHIVGNPWKPVEFMLIPYSGNCSQIITVQQLAQAVYDGDQSAVGPLHDALIDAGAPEEFVRHFADALPCQQCGGTGWREDVAGEDLDGRGGRVVNVRCKHDDSLVPMVQEYNDVGTSYWFNLLEPNTRHLTPERAQPKHPKGCWAIDAIINKE